MANSLSLKLYLATRARADPAARRTAARDDSVREKERMGEASHARPDGPLIWIHSGQDRHALAAREFAHRLRLERDELRFLFTTAADRRRDSEPGMITQFAPDDSIPAIRRFLDLSLIHI